MPLVTRRFRRERDRSVRERVIRQLQSGQEAEYKKENDELATRKVLVEREVNARLTLKEVEEPEDNKEGKDIYLMAELDEQSERKQREEV